LGVGTKIYRREAALGSLQGAVALVTGASRGLGASIAEELGRRGAKVTVNYAGSQGPAEEVAAEISEAQGGGEAVAVQADVADAEDAKRLVEETVERFGRIDVLVNNAGINIDRTLKRLSLEDWYKVLQVDLNGCFHTVHAALPHMIEQEFGRVINMSSFVGEAGNVGQSNYAAAKSGLFGFTKTAALELARYNITVNAISPGFIETEMVAAIPDNAKEKILEQIPLGRLGKPEEIAKAVRYVVEDGDYMTGNILDINGGVYMR
jgi:NAD(P)-dependent dehydrogenase (short-subunit alcohol dehydrogenase family)